MTILLEGPLFFDLGSELGLHFFTGLDHDLRVKQLFYTVHFTRNGRLLLKQLANGSLDSPLLTTNFCRFYIDSVAK